MSTNEIFDPGDKLALAATHPTTPVSGGPARLGQIPLVCLVTEATNGGDGLASYTLTGVHDLSVKGIDGSGNAAVVAGDILYYTDGDTPVLNKKTTGVRFGYALEGVSSGGTDTIRVKLGYGG